MAKIAEAIQKELEARKWWSKCSLAYNDLPVSNIISMKKKKDHCRIHLREGGNIHCDKCFRGWFSKQLDKMKKH